MGSKHNMMTWEAVLHNIYTMKKVFLLNLLKLNIYWSYNKICSNVILLKTIVLVAKLAKYVLKYSELR